jgi:hypothetical protein
MKSKRPKTPSLIQIASYPERAGRRIYPWLEIEVGQSFLLRSHNDSGGYVNYANRRYAPRHFISSCTPEGTRIWRDK